MKQFKYNVGDHVVIEESNTEWINRLAGKTGVITECFEWGNNRGYDYRVCPDDWGNVNMDTGIWCRVKCLVKEPCNDKVVITTDGVTTTATLYSKNTKVRTATAKCSPDDEFDFAIGVKLAMERLYPEKIEPKTEPTPKYLNCKFIVTNLGAYACGKLTEGRVYEMSDGRFVSDCGYGWPFNDPIENADDLIAYFNGERKGKEVAFGYSTIRPIIIKE